MEETMQTKKKEVRDKILEASREEILRLGYDKASIRNIAKIAGINHGNIKTYFGTKEDLFLELVRPATEYLDDYLADHIEYEKMSQEELRVFLDVRTSQKNHFAFFAYLKKHREPFYLLFFKGTNDFSKNIRSTYAQKFEKISDRFLDALMEKGIIQNHKISTIFKQTISSLFIVSIEQIITNDPNQEEMAAYAEEFSKFVHYGTYGSIHVLKEEKE